MNNENNKLYISGTLANDVTLAYESRSEKFYEFTVSIPRLSGIEDNLPVTISERIMPHDLKKGAAINAICELRSYNKLIGDKSRLMLTVFVKEVCSNPIGKNPNAITIIGHACKKPIYRTTPMNREIADLLIAVNRAYGKSDYIPVIAWGRNAKFAAQLDTGSKIAIQGRVQSRNYQKVYKDGSTATHTAYEISASQLAELDENDNVAPWEWIIAEEESKA